MTLQLKDAIAVSIIQRRHQYGAVLHDCPQSVLIIVLIHKIVNITSEFLDNIFAFVVGVGHSLIRLVLSAPGFRAGIVYRRGQKLRRRKSINIS